MAVHYILVLALVQGITEFLPISSSGHLFLVGEFIALEDHGLTMDIAVHAGALLAVMMYFWRDVWAMFKGASRLLIIHPNQDSKLLVNILAGTIPVVLAGFFLYEYVEVYLRDVEIVAWTTLGFGILLWFADAVGMTIRRIEHLGIPSALFIGLAQVLSLIPGTSRSGITITAARIIGMERSESARFSMLLSIPAILAASSLGAYKLWQSGNIALTYDAILAATVSFLAALITIILLMAWLRRAGYLPFVLYRIGLGLYLLYYFYA